MPHPAGAHSVTAPDASKASTALAAAVGYPDFFWALSGAISAQTGQVLELQAITIFGYLGISLFIAAIMAIYNQATRIPER